MSGKGEGLHRESNEIQNKTRKYILYIAGLTILLMVLGWRQDKNNEVLSEDETLIRGQPGSGEQQLELTVTVPKLQETYEYSLTLPERIADASEREQLFEQAKAEIDETFPARGEELSNITQKVNLPDTVADGMVEVSWNFLDIGIINADGSICAQQVTDAGKVVRVEAVLEYGGYSCSYEFACHVYPEELDSGAALMRWIDMTIDKKLASENQTERFSLPQSAGEYTLEWSQKNANTPVIMLVLGIVTMIAVVWSEGEQQRRDEENRKQEMLLEYPKMVSKLALLISAGMTVRQAWMRLTDGYDRQKIDKCETKKFMKYGRQVCDVHGCKRRKKKRGRENVLYEQMQITARQMQDGMSEVAAYEAFGERSRMALYRRFSMLLIQNLKKGSAGLVTALESEADRAFEERKHTAKRLGEEAGTKLLAPMLLMLLMIMVMLLVPAMMNMQVT